MTHDGNRGILLIALLVVCATAVLAAPLITVDKTVLICENGKCSNSTTVKEGLEHIAAPLTAGIRSIHVYDRPHPLGNGSAGSQVGRTGDMSFYVFGLNTTAYRALVIGTIQQRYEQRQREATAWAQVQRDRTYPLPSWAPRPGQCDLGVWQMNWRGERVCTR